MSIASPTTTAERDSRTHYLRRLVLTGRQLERATTTGDTDQIMEAVEDLDATVQQARVFRLLPDVDALPEDDLYALIGVALTRAEHAQHPVEAAAALLGDALDRERRRAGITA